MLFHLPDAKHVTLFLYRELVRQLATISTQKQWSDKQIYRTYMSIKEVQMADRKGKKKDAKTEGRYQDSPNVIWCNIKTDDTDLAAFNEMESTPETLAIDILQFIADGFSVSVKRRDGGETYQVTAISQDTADKNYGHGFSTFGDNPYDTLCFALFKFYQVAGRDLSQYANTNTQKRRLY